MDLGLFCDFITPLPHTHTHVPFLSCCFDETVLFLFTDNSNAMCYMYNICIPPAKHVYIHVYATAITFNFQISVSKAVHLYTYMYLVCVCVCVCVCVPYCRGWWKGISELHLLHLDVPYPLQQSHSDQPHHYCGGQLETQHGNCAWKIMCIAH